VNIQEALKFAKTSLKENEVEGPDASASFLLRQILGCDKAFLLTHPEYKITKLQELRYKRWIKRRAKHEPVWYITGKIEFMGLDLHVNTHVLIPRPETELMIDMIIKDIRGQSNPKKILDVGTGSGTIALSLAKNTSGNYVFASDISERALSVAKKNALTNKLSGNIEFRIGDLLAPWIGDKFDIIVANLPYVPHEDMATLAFDLTHYEPRLALDGGVLGLEVYKIFIQELTDFLNPGAKVYMEIGYDQGRYIEEFVHKYLPKANVKVLGDYQQIDRIAIIEV
jgi:release factor glutamine methyltransferase